MFLASIHWNFQKHSFIPIAEHLKIYVLKQNKTLITEKNNSGCHSIKSVGVSYYYYYYCTFLASVVSGHDRVFIANEFSHVIKTRVLLRRFIGFYFESHTIDRISERQILAILFQRASNVFSFRYCHLSFLYGGTL